MKPVQLQFHQRPLGLARQSGRHETAFQREPPLLDPESGGDGADEFPIRAAPGANEPVPFRVLAGIAFARGCLIMGRL
jgi:hypothetical protein